MQRSSWTRPPAKTMRDMLHIDAPIFAELFLVSLFVMVDTALLKPCGTTAFAAYRILISLQNFAYLGAEAVATTALIYASGMRSCRRAGIPSIITTVGIVLVRPSLVYLLAGPLGVCGAWIAIMTDEIVRCVLLFALRGKMWRQFTDAPTASPAVV